MSKKKICIVSPSLYVGGIERVLTTLANYMESKGYDVHFVVIYPFKPFFSLNKNIKLYIPPIKYDYCHHTSFEKIKFYIKVLSPLNGYVKRTINEISPDTVMCFGDWFPHLVMLSLKGKYPFFYSNRSNPSIRYNSLFEFIRSLAYKLYPPTGIIAQTSLAQKRKEEIFKKNCPEIRIIPNPLRLDIVDSSYKRENIIIAVGRLYMDKGFMRLIEVFSKLDASDWTLMIVGSGVHEPLFRQRVSELGLESKVVFTGSSSNVPQLLSKSKIFVMSSHKEGYPNALCEAMASGLACLSFDIVAGPSDIITNNVDGILVKDNDLDEMTVKLQYLIDNPSEIERLGMAAMKIRDKLSIEVIGKRFLDFITK